MPGMNRMPENITISVIKRNFEKGDIPKEQIEWLIKHAERVEDELARQRKHEAFLLEELDKLGWFDNRF